MRLDRLLCCLRFVKTRSKAQGWIDQGHMRCNGVRVTRHSHPVAPGDILVFSIGEQVRVVRIDALPPRRGSAADARRHYRFLDPQADNAIADCNAPPSADCEGRQAEANT